MGGGGVGGGTGKCTAKCHHQCHTSGLQWPAPRGTPGVHHWHCQCTKMSNLQPMPMPSTTESPGQLPWGTRVYHHKACSKTCWSCPGALPTGKDHAPLPCPRQAGCNTKAITKQNTCPQSISSTNQGQAPWASTNSNQPFSTTKMGWLVLPIVHWRH